MTRLSHSIFVSLAALYLVTGQEPAHEPKYKLKNKVLEQTFNKLLHAVTAVNEERVDSLQKFTELENYLPKVTRTSGQPIVAFIVPNPKSKDLSRDVDIKDLLYGKRPTITPDTLRSWKGCNKSAAKGCKKACSDAFKDVCDEYKCKNSMKKFAKKSCKAKCNTEFGIGYE